MSYINFSRNPVPVEAITANHQQPNFRFEFTIKVYDAGGAEKEAITFKGVPDSTGQFTFDAQPLLHAMLAPDVPMAGQSTINFGGNSFLSWTADVSEWYGSPDVIQQSTTRYASNKVLMGGLSFREFPGNTFFADRADKFLTHAPDNKLLAPGQPDFLYYLVPESWASLYLHAEVFYNDGTSQLTVAKQAAAASGKLAIIPAGFTQLGLDDINVAKFPLSYKLWVAPSNLPTDAGASEKRSYLLDYFAYPHARQFLYQNSLGAFESIRCTGRFEVSRQIDRQNGERVIGSSYSPSDASRFSYNSMSYASIKGNSGMQLNRAWFNHLQEFIRSNEVFEIQGNSLVPVVIESNNYKGEKSYDYELAAEFEYSIAQTDNAYTP